MITIIVLLILAGITLSLVIGENGIINRSKESGKSYTKASIKEEIELTIADIEMEVLSQGNQLTKDSILEKLSGKLAGLTIRELNDDELTGNYKNYSYKIDKNFVVTILEEDELRTYLYKEGKDTTTLTGGLNLIHDSVSTIENKTDCIYNHRFGGSNGGSAISTNSKVNVTSYQYLCIEYKAGSNVYNDGIRLHLEDTPYTSVTGGPTGKYYSDSANYNVENGILRWNIKDITGSYYVGIGLSGAEHTYIYKIWFE